MTPQQHAVGNDAGTPSDRDPRTIDDLSSFAPTEHAIEIAQPYAELILRGVKRVATYSVTTDWRGQVRLYASSAWAHGGSDLAALLGHPITRAECTRGVHLGHVDLVDAHPAESCRTCGIWGADVGYHWILDKPARLLSLPLSSPRLGGSTPPPQIRM